MTALQSPLSDVPTFSNENSHFLDYFPPTSRAVDGRFVFQIRVFLPFCLFLFEGQSWKLPFLSKISPFLHHFQQFYMPYQPLDPIVSGLILYVLAPVFLPVLFFVVH